LLCYADGTPRTLSSFPPRRSSDLSMSRVLRFVAPQPVFSWADTDQAALTGNGNGAAPGVTGPGPDPDRADAERRALAVAAQTERDRKSTRLNSSHVKISYAVFCLK